MSETTLFIDAKNTLYRHNYTSSLTDPEGNKVSGVFGMFKDVTNQIRIHNPTNVVICWDKGKSKGRVALYPEYKAHRKQEDKELLENLGYQTRMAKMLFKCLPVKQMVIQDVEADDIIGFLSSKLPGKKIIFSNDSDFYQLINDDISQFVPKKKMTLNKHNIEKEMKLGIGVEDYILHKAMVGDSSDNIVGLKGIGNKTATKIIKGDIKKIPVIDKEILKRNVKLIKIGHILTTQDKKDIISLYKKEREKESNTILLKRLCMKLGFRSILSSFGTHILVYKPLIRRT